MTSLQYFMFPKLEQHYYNLNLFTYWFDFIVTNSILIMSFVALSLSSWSGIHTSLLLLITWISIYRVGAFIHELSHQRGRKDFRLFYTIWNISAGLFILMPAVRFKFPHLQHHKIGIFSTVNDAQYPLIKNNISLKLILFIILPLGQPLLNILVILGKPSKSLYTKLERLIYPEFKLTNKERRELDLLELYYAICLIIVIFLFPINILALWYISQVGGWFLASLRVPLEHSLNNTVDKTLSDHHLQLTDSYTHQSNPILAFILQPVGLRYHTAHHMYPQVPYHNLKILHQHLKDTLGEEYTNQII